MKSVSLGSTGLTTPVQGYGCMRLDDSSESASDVLNRALDLGATFLDTADMYGSATGRNEELVGRGIGARRDEVILCTKFGAVRGPGGLTFRADAGYVRTACEASLRRLGTEVVDLYYLHHPDVTVPIEDTVGAMAELVTAGKVRHLGLSNSSRDDLRAAHAVHPIAAVQEEWSLFDRAVEEMLPVCLELGVGVVPYCPHGRGDVHPAAADIAERHGVTPSQIALAWVQQRSDVWGIPVVPIPGTTRVSHLEQNVAATDIALSAEELEQLES